MKEEDFKWKLTLSAKEMLEIERQVNRRFRDRWRFLKDHLAQDSCQSGGDGNG